MPQALVERHHSVRLEYALAPRWWIECRRKTTGKWHWHEWHRSYWIKQTHIGQQIRKQTTQRRWHHIAIHHIVQPLSLFIEHGFNGIYTLSILIVLLNKCIQFSWYFGLYQFAGFCAMCLLQIDPCAHVLTKLKVFHLTHCVTCQRCSGSDRP